MKSKIRVYFHHGSLSCENGQVGSIEVIEGKYGPWFKTEILNEDYWREYVLPNFHIDCNTRGVGDTPEQILTNVLVKPDDEPRTPLQESLIYGQQLEGWWLEDVNVLSGDDESLLLVFYHGDERSADFDQVNLSLNAVKDLIVIMETCFTRD